MLFMRRSVEILREEKGVSIVFACLLLVVLLILGSIIVAYGYSNYNRAVESSSGRHDSELVGVVSTTLHKTCQAFKSSDLDLDDASLASTAPDFNNQYWSFLYDLMTNCQEGGEKRSVTTVRLPDGSQVFGSVLVTVSNAAPDVIEGAGNHCNYRLVVTAQACDESGVAKAESVSQSFVVHIGRPGEAKRTFAKVDDITKVVLL